jgi:cytochrome c oxidase assembly factor CtaG
MSECLGMRIPILFLLGFIGLFATWVITLLYVHEVQAFNKLHTLVVFTLVVFGVALASSIIRKPPRVCTQVMRHRVSKICSDNIAYCITDLNLSKKDRIVRQLCCFDGD